MGGGRNRACIPKTGIARNDRVFVGGRGSRPTRRARVPSGILSVAAKVYTGVEVDPRSQAMGAKTLDNCSGGDYGFGRSLGTSVFGSKKFRLVSIRLLNQNAGGAMRQIPLLGWFLSFLIMAAMFSLSNQSAWAQANRASITGTVTYSTGALVSGVEVTATNTGTNESAKTVSNQDGIYVIPNLFPGQYSVEFRRNGFETLRRPVITLESTQVAQINAELKVGAITDTITVTADAPILDQERASIGTNMKGDVV